jgi:hypothetical protein
MNIHLEKHYLQNQTNKIMRIYYYLLFRLYTQLTNPKNQNSEKYDKVVFPRIQSRLIP